MKCAIAWIDCNGNSTKDDNEAIGFAVLDGKKFPICAEHRASMGRARTHHGECSHVSDDPAKWSFEPLEELPIGLLYYVSGERGYRIVGFSCGCSSLPPYRSSKASRVWSINIRPYKAVCYHCGAILLDSIACELYDGR